MVSPISKYKIYDIRWIVITSKLISLNMQTCHLTNMPIQKKKLPYLLISNFDPVTHATFPPMGFVYSPSDHG
jgi:hypothetical protein